MDPIKTIGKDPGPDARRDCIHLAILPAIAAEDMYACEEVGLAYGTTNQVRRKPSEYGGQPIGIVDPFRQGRDRFVKEGERVWVFLLPGTITGLRHDWTHPAIDRQPSAASEAEQWLRQFADRWNFDYDEMIAEAQHRNGGAVVARGIDLHSACELAPGDEAKFWECLAALTGREFGEEHRKEFTWTCSC